MIEFSKIYLNNDEQRALEWIRNQEYSDIQPIYGDPPDFVVDNRYAVEVTRLERKLMFWRRFNKGGGDRQDIALHAVSINFLRD